MIISKNTSALINKYIVNILLVFAMFFFAQCHSDNYYDSLNHYSPTIEASKEKGAFIKKLAPLTNPSKYHDSISIDVNEAWLEKGWHIGNFGKAIIDTGVFNIIVYHKKFPILPDSLTFGIGWDVGGRSSWSLTGNDYFMTLTIDTIPSQDTLSWTVYKRGVTYADSLKPLGDFILTK